MSVIEGSLISERVILMRSTRGNRSPKRTDEGFQLGLYALPVASRTQKYVPGEPS